MNVFLSGLPEEVKPVELVVWSQQEKATLPLKNIDIFFGGGVGEGVVGGHRR